VFRTTRIGTKRVKVASKGFVALKNSLHCFFGEWCPENWKFVGGNLESTDIFSSETIALTGGRVTKSGITVRVHSTWDKIGWKSGTDLVGKFTEGTDNTFLIDSARAIDLNGEHWDTSCIGTSADASENALVGVDGEIERCLAWSSELDLFDTDSFVTVVSRGTVSSFALSVDWESNTDSKSTRHVSNTVDFSSTFVSNSSVSLNNASSILSTDSNTSCRLEDDTVNNGLEARIFDLIDGDGSNTTQTQRAKSQRTSQ